MSVSSQIKKARCFQSWTFSKQVDAKGIFLCGSGEAGVAVGEGSTLRAMYPGVQPEWVPSSQSRETYWQFICKSGQSLLWDWAANEILGACFFSLVLHKVRNWAQDFKGQGFSQLESTCHRHFDPLQHLDSFTWRPINLNDHFNRKRKWKHRFRRKIEQLLAGSLGVS